MKPTPSNNFMFSDEDLLKFKELYPKTKNPILSEMFGLSVHQVYRLGTKLWLKKIRKPKKKVVQVKKVVKPPAEKKVHPRLNNISKKEFSPITHSSNAKQEVPEWWIKKNKELMKNRE